MLLNGLGCVTIRKGLPSVTLPLSVRLRGPPAPASRLQVCSCTTRREALSPYRPTRAEAHAPSPRRRRPVLLSRRTRPLRLLCVVPASLPALTAFSRITASYLLQWLLSLLPICVVGEALNDLLVFRTRPQGPFADRCTCSPANGLSKELHGDSDVQPGLGTESLHDFD